MVSLKKLLSAEAVVCRSCWKHYVPLGKTSMQDRPLLQGRAAKQGRAELQGMESLLGSQGFWGRVTAQGRPAVALIMQLGERQHDIT